MAEILVKMYENHLHKVALFKLCLIQHVKKEKEWESDLKRSLINLFSKFWRGSKNQLANTEYNYRICILMFKMHLPHLTKTNDVINSERTQSNTLICDCTKIWCYNFRTLCKLISTAFKHVAY